MNSRTGFAQNAAVAVLRVALVLSLVLPAWSVYRSLPPDASTPFDVGAPAGTTALRIVMRVAPPGGAQPAKVPFQLYPINVQAARNEYESEPRRGLRFEDFVARLMNGARPLSGELDERGEAVIDVSPGKWWVHATLNGSEEFTWRLPVNVGRRPGTIELTPENAYTREKSF